MTESIETMKKGEEYIIDIEGMTFPGKAWGKIEHAGNSYKCFVKDALTGQKLKVQITKKRGTKVEGRILEVIEKAPNEIEPSCSVFGRCGGCTYQNLPYEKQLELKARYVRALLEAADIGAFDYLPIVASPQSEGYRNKMEYSFGDDTLNGPLTLGLHEKGSFYNVLCTDGCVITDSNFDLIRKAVLEYFRRSGDTYYHKRTHNGFLRHLVVRKGKATGEILINLVTGSQGELNADEFVGALIDLPLDGKIVGILHTINDREADVVQEDDMRLLYGESILHDRILGLDFEISPFSFFQTNTLGAEKLYGVVRDFVGEKRSTVLYDLYCGTGTIAQIMSPTAEKVIGIELVEEAVEAAKLNAKRNGITNCTFIAGDVLREVDQLTEKADVIILDPPRDGIHPKAIFKILDFQPDVFVYVSCKATSLARDLPFFTHAGYRVEKVQCVDMFPHTGHVETVVLMSRVKE